MSKKSAAESHHVGCPGSNSVCADSRPKTGERIASHVGVGEARNTGTSVIEYVGKNRIRVSGLGADNSRYLNSFQRFPEPPLAEKVLAGTEGQFVGEVDYAPVPYIVVRIASRDSIRVP